MRIVHKNVSVQLLLEEFFRRLKDGHPEADITLDITEMPELERPPRCRRLLVINKKQTKNKYINNK